MHRTPPVRSTLSTGESRLPPRLEFDLETEGERGLLRLAAAGLWLAGSGVFVWLAFFCLAAEWKWFEAALARSPLVSRLPAALFFGGSALMALGCYLRWKTEELIVLDGHRRRLCRERRFGGSTSVEPVAAFAEVRGVGVRGRRGPRGGRPYCEFWLEVELVGGVRLRLTDPFVLDGRQPAARTPDHPVLAELRRNATLAARMMEAPLTELSIAPERAPGVRIFRMDRYHWDNGSGLSADDL